MLYKLQLHVAKYLLACELLKKYKKYNIGNHYSRLPSRKLNDLRIMVMPIYFEDHLSGIVNIGRGQIIGELTFCQILNGSGQTSYTEVGAKSIHYTKTEE